MAKRPRHTPSDASIIRRFAVLVAASFLGGCAVLTPVPPKTGVSERLASFPIAGLPLERPVSIYWNDRMVPFIDAETDGDAAFALGMVHAHLRLGQMEISRRISQGRISEMTGPFFVGVDRSLRVLGLERASRKILDGLPDDTRLWLTRFVDGLNHYQQNIADLPHEFAVLGLEREPWTVEEVITLGRLAGVDVNWLAWFGLLPLRSHPDWPRIWRTALRYGARSPSSFGDSAEYPIAGNRDASVLSDLLEGKGRNGSNSIVIAGHRSGGGGALIASDPHLGISLPNFWLIAGLKSPSYHVVGLMPPGLPIFGLGRNPDIAWGGTNMRAASSDLVDISGENPAILKTETHTVKIRYWMNESVDVRISPWGPVISDAPAFPAKTDRTVALRWMGHEESDEFSAFLRASRADSWQSFRDAFENYAVSGQNMLYADRFGNIGQVSAARLPKRNASVPNDIFVDPRTAHDDWQAFATSRELPATFNPPEGAIASANNRPGPSNVPISYFFSPKDRIERLRFLLGKQEAVTPRDLMNWQRDVAAPSSRRLKDGLIGVLRQGDWRPESLDAIAALDTIQRWDGNYGADSIGALAFEAFFGTFAEEVYRFLGRSDEFAGFSRSSAAKDRLWEDVKGIAPDTLRQLAEPALERAADAAAKYGHWGAVHRLRLDHAFANLPLVGFRYRFSDLPVGGSQETLMKTAHQLEADSVHGVRYGSQARHVSDLSDPDANDFVLLGGQDGWFGSPAFIDQVALWERGEYIRVPLRLDTVRATFERKLRLTPERATKKP